jgi:uncharacterized protein (DUF427 family)
MNTYREALIPGDDHPIELAPFKGRGTVTSNGRTVADTTAALALREASHPTVYYVPLSDVDQDVLRPNDTTSHCPYKGDASYFDVVDPATHQAVADAVWHYREPYAAVAEIADHIAFYTNRVDVNVQPVDVQPVDVNVQPANG